MQIESLQYKKSLIGCSSDSKLIICIRVMEPLLRIADNRQLRDDTCSVMSSILSFVVTYLLTWEIDQCDFPSRRVSVTRKEYGMSGDIQGKIMMLLAYAVYQSTGHKIHVLRDTYSNTKQTVASMYAWRMMEGLPE